MSNLKKLQRQWYNKLKRNGFNDIEKGPNELKTYDSMHFKRKRRMSPVQFEAHVRYYQLAEHLATEVRATKLTHPKIKRIWDLHSRGYTQAEIARTVKVGTHTVVDVIRQLDKLIVRQSGEEE